MEHGTRFFDRHYMIPPVIVKMARMHSRLLPVERTDIIGKVSSIKTGFFDVKPIATSFIE